MLQLRVEKCVLAQDESTGIFVKV